MSNLDIINNCQENTFIYYLSGYFDYYSKRIIISTGDKWQLLTVQIFQIIICDP